MREKAWRAVLYVAIAAAVGVGVWQAVREERLAQPLPPGTPAPELIGLTRDGQPFDLRELRGRVALVSFWASWCGPCRREMPVLLSLEREYAARGVTLVAVNVDDPDGREALVTEFFAELGIAAPRVVYTGAQAVHAFKALRLPTLYVIDAQGRVVAGHTSLQSEATLRDEIERALRR